MILLSLSSAILGKIIPILEKYKLKYQVVETGEELLERAKKQNPQLILLEKDLPLLDGFALTLLLKTSEKTKNIPIIALCKCNFPEEHQKAIECGADVLLTYPFAEDELVELLSKFFKKKFKPKEVD